MVDRFANTVLLGLLVVLFVTGLGMLYGSWLPWIFDLHRVAAFAVVALLPWKASIAYRSLRRRVRGHAGWLSTLPSVPLAALLILVVTLGLLWMWRLGPYRTLLRQTLIAWHWILGLVMVPFFVAHVVVRWPSPQPTDFASRRGALRLFGLGTAAAAGWLLGVDLARLRATEEQPRRSTTGSRGFGQLTGNDFPVTGERTADVDLEQWRLNVEGAVERPLTLTYAGLTSQTPVEMTQTLDCTSGWYTVQEWRGVPLISVLETAGGLDGAGVRLISETGYNHTYPMAEARTILLATHVGDQVLSPQHGFPLRAVVPGRRGWFWVKWLHRVEVLDDPVDVFAGILSAARQVLRQF